LKNIPSDNESVDGFYGTDSEKINEADLKSTHDVQEIEKENYNFMLVKINENLVSGNNDGKCFSKFK
jgi:hypothetical protein